MQLMNYGYWHITKLQSDILVEDNKLIIDFLLRFENLQNDFDKLCDEDYWTNDKFKEEYRHLQYCADTLHVYYERTKQ